MTRAGKQPGGDFWLDPDEYARAAKDQKAHARALAAALAAGEMPERELDRQFIAAILREWAENLPEVAPRARGSDRKFSHGDAALHYAAHRMRGKSHGQALAEVADHFGVSEVAVNKAIAPYRAGTFAALGIPDPGNKN